MEYVQGLKPGAMMRHDSYRIERVLGQGGFGITYLATDLNLDRLVAIKEFFPKDYCDRESSTSHVTLGTKGSVDFVNKLRVKFLKEARNIAKLDHPGIIKIHAAFEENNTAYYVMDYIEGESLSEMVKRHGLLSKERSIEYIKKVGKALEYVHARKINHLDVKPANIMVRRSDDNPILIDFGLSKQYDSSGNQTSTTPTGISHGYAPMEQYNDGGVREFSPQTDLYSLAATLYYILSGVTPPQATKLAEDDLIFPAAIPAHLIGPISKAMSTKRVNRHESVNAFVSDVCGTSDNGDTEFRDAGSSRGASRGQSQSQGQSYKQEPKPQPQPEPITNPIQQPEPNSKRKLYIGAAVGVAVIVIALIAVLSGKNGSGGGNVPDVDSVALKVAKQTETPKVSDFYWESPLGIASYTGEVRIDSVSGKKIPHGKGVAKITGGEYKGSTYDGSIVNGNMEGEAIYTLSNGDIFKGTYKNNKYHTGRYIVKETGEYFEGTFKNGDPDKGSWYNHKGKKI